jgi:hypothetical protein
VAISITCAILKLRDKYLENIMFIAYKGKMYRTEKCITGGHHVYIMNDRIADYFGTVYYAKTALQAVKAMLLK